MNLGKYDFVSFFLSGREGGFVFFYIKVSALVFIIYPEGKEACGRETAMIWIACGSYGENILILRINLYF